KPLVHVAASFIRNDFGHFYVTPRLEGQDFAQPFEFPGGKVDDGESPEQAFRRELEEEIGIHILNATLYERFQFESPTKMSSFYFYLVDESVGEPFGREGLAGFRVAQNELYAGQFPSAHVKLLERLL
ncbi:8-oxo-dGTP diphosphatase MutT, partial [Pasteurella multocida]|uniref:8-oxo-dGTP diphosphatase MutT n=1 Tax=Pasteurella multocida TaxID=747 RepID=UPI0014613AF4